MLIGSSLMQSITRFVRGEFYILAAIPFFMTSVIQTAGRNTIAPAPPPRTCGLFFETGRLKNKNKFFICFNKQDENSISKLLCLCFIPFPLTGPVVPLPSAPL